MIAPQPPWWAVEAGMVEPVEGEDFRAYCARIGIPPAVANGFLDGLDERTAPLANSRLATHLMREWPEAFRAGVEKIEERAAEQARASALRLEEQEWHTGAWRSSAARCIVRG